MKTLVTVTRDGDKVRVSKVTAHGEEVVHDIDVVAQSLAMLLWMKLAKSEDISGGDALLPWNTIHTRLDRLTESVEKLTTQLEKHAHQMKEFQTKVSQPKPTPVRVGQ